ncbi:benzoate/H(+) symporter BenE family transporter [Aeromicrobium massiliense]|uniref:benzoate/H(+) symporter BenE family transporter n=1 Tax=Aeromicrobium massiliense TaxID=1464554 RepID=UPI00067693D0|nr:benzoate/H(+) symporter BenE family transporter [Aeromicrobium massiliense]
MRDSRPYVAGLVAALVGFTSSFAVVLAGLVAVGASTDQAASGLLALCVVQGLGMLVLALRHRQPLTLAWSTPGAALLASTGQVDGGWAAAVGGFGVCGLLVLLTALWPALGGLVARVPVPVAQAMLAGVVLPLCLAPVRSLEQDAWPVVPVLAAWLVLVLASPRWAAPGALVAALVVAVASGPDAALVVAPDLAWTTPVLTVGGVVGVALPLFVVTMASQNVPGVAVMRAHGYDVPWRPAMLTTGLGTVAAAPFGGHAVNLAAISAALAAGTDAGPDPSRRWRAALSAGGAYLVLAVVSASLVALVTSAPAGVVQAAAGLALVPVLGSALAAATSDPASREAAVVTFVVAASGTALAGVGAAFWSLVAGVAVHLLVRARTLREARRAQPSHDGGPPTDT